MHFPPWPPLPPLLRAHLDAVDPDHLAHDTLDDPTDPGPPRPWDLCALTGDLRTAVSIDTTTAPTSTSSPPAGPTTPPSPTTSPASPSPASTPYAATTAAYVGRWHTDLENFHRRLTTALGPDSPCPRSHHDQQPTRYAVDQANRAMTKRR